MKKKYQNIFFIFGLVVLAVMVSRPDNHAIAEQMP